MSYDGKLLARAREKLDSERRAHETERLRRLEEIYNAVPEIKQTDTRLRVIAVQAMKDAVSGDTAAVEKARSLSSALRREREARLVSAGFPRGYTDERIVCKSCGDTGYSDGRMCVCLKKLYDAEQQRELSVLFKLGDQTFDSFSLDWYDAIPDENTHISARDAMETVYEACVNYARRLGTGSKSLFFTGGTGLGKTFLAACIAKVASDGGFSVVYDTATSVFERFGAARFNGNADAEAEVRRYMTCDLMILDDLGTEMTTAFSVSSLYELVNSRLMTGRKTIITSNMQPEELTQRYSPQIASRISGEYIILRFYGSDIRRLKNKK